MNTEKKRGKSKNRLLVIKEDIFRADKAYAKKIRRLVSGRALVFNIISSPGSGKTTFLEKVIPGLKKKGIEIAVVEGDCFTAEDGKRISRLKVPVVQVNTGGGCHLSAYAVYRAFKKLPTALKGKRRIIFIENVGNLVCPSGFDLGEDMKIAILSVTEGDDKVLKYPLLFINAGLIILNKTDLIRHTDFSVRKFYRALKKTGCRAKVMELSCVSGKGLKEIVDFFVFFSKSNIQLSSL